MLLQEATQDDLSDPCMLLAKSEANKSDLRFKLGAVIKYGKTKISAYNVMCIVLMGLWRSLALIAKPLYGDSELRR